MSIIRNTVASAVAFASIITGAYVAGSTMSPIIVSAQAAGPVAQRFEECDFSEGLTQRRCVSVGEGKKDSLHSSYILRQRASGYVEVTYIHRWRALRLTAVWPRDPKVGA